MALYLRVLDPVFRSTSWVRVLEDPPGGVDYPTSSRIGIKKRSKLVKYRVPGTKYRVPYRVPGTKYRVHIGPYEAVQGPIEAI